MKKIILVLLMVLTILPKNVLAKNYYDDYNTLDLAGALKEENIELQNKSYKESSDQVVIYLFRGNGCGFCRNFLTFLSSISKDYGKYFKLVSFEVWYDENNSNLLGKVAKITGVEAKGVPYFIIGEKVFDGYAANMDTEIKEAIMNEYSNPSEDIFNKVAQYDDGTLVIPDVKSEETNNNASNYSNTSSSGNSDTFAIVFWNFFFVAVGTMVVVYLNIKNKQEILKAIALQREVKEEKSNVLPKEKVAVKEVKKATNNRKKTKKDD